SPAVRVVLAILAQASLITASFATPAPVSDTDVATSTEPVEAFTLSIPTTEFVEGAIPPQSSPSSRLLAMASTVLETSSSSLR
ncbi:hypothetical protein H0H93_003883, partial [Arthromyces matolae]